MPSRVSSTMKHIQIMATLLYLVLVGVEPSRGSRLLRGSAINDDRMTFHFQENRTGKEGDGVAYDVQPKGKVSPSGPSHRGNAYIDGHELSKSKPSPAVGHMQIDSRAKSRRIHGVDHMMQQQNEGERILYSTPSPGAGH